MQILIEFARMFLLVLVLVIAGAALILRLSGHLRRCPKCKSYLTMSSRGWILPSDGFRYVHDIECRRCGERSRLDIPHDQWPPSSPDMIKIAPLNRHRVC
jgi:hypothetical protein